MTDGSRDAGAFYGEWSHSVLLAVPGLPCFHSAAQGHGEQSAGFKTGEGGNLTKVVMQA